MQNVLAEHLCRKHAFAILNSDVRNMQRENMLIELAICMKL